MPTDIGPYVQAGATIASTAANAYLQKQANDASEAFQYKMFGLQNDYNDPKAQMLRLRLAGLNPNMVYANGNAIMRSASPGSYNPKALDVSGIGQGVSQFFATKEKQSQIALMDSNTRLNDIKAQKEAANVTGAGLKNTGLDLNNAIKSVDLSAKQLANNISQSNADWIQRKLWASVVKLENEGTLSGYKIPFEWVNQKIKQDQLRASLSNTTKLGLLYAANTSKSLAETSRIKSLTVAVDQMVGIRKLDVVLSSKGLTKNDDLMARMGVLISSGLISGEDATGIILGNTLSGAGSLLGKKIPSFKFKPSGSNLKSWSPGMRSYNQRNR